MISWFAQICKKDFDKNRKIGTHTIFKSLGTGAEELFICSLYLLGVYIK
jgi:hypothetical protein